MRAHRRSINPGRESAMNIRSKLALMGATAVLGAAMAAPLALAGQSSATLAVSASVAGACSVNSAALNFGSISSGVSTAVQANTNVTVNCTFSTMSPTITVNTNGAGLRTMVNGASSLTYTLFTNAGLTVPFNGQNGTNNVPITLSVGPNPSGTATIFAQTTAGTALISGTYNDNATVFVNF
jgi:spore coat protein U-like protein